MNESVDITWKHKDIYFIFLNNFLSRNHSFNEPLCSLLRWFLTVLNLFLFLFENFPHSVFKVLKWYSYYLSIIRSKIIYKHEHLWKIYTCLWILRWIDYKDWYFLHILLKIIQTGDWNVRINFLLNKISLNYIIYLLCCLSFRCFYIKIVFVLRVLYIHI